MPTNFGLATTRYLHLEAHVLIYQASYTRPHNHACIVSLLQVPLVPPKTKRARGPESQTALDTRRPA